MITSPVLPTNDDVSSHYDELDHFYRDVWGEHLHHGIWLGRRDTHHDAVRNLVDIVVQKAKVVEGSRVVDVGCGYGATTRILAEDYGADVTALTISPVQFRYAVEKHGSLPGVHFLLQNWLEHDLPEASFDAVIAIESTEHMPSFEKFVKKARQVLRPGGRLVVCAWVANAKAPLASRELLLKPICQEGRMYAMRTQAEICRTLHEFGFSQVDVSDFSGTAKRSWRIGAVRTLKGILTDSTYRRYLMDRSQGNRIFTKTVMRILAAYELGQMTYEMYSAQLPTANERI